MEFTLTVDALPEQAGVDPLIKLIDRNPDDNVVKVEKEVTWGEHRAARSCRPADGYFFSSTRISSMGLSPVFSGR